jgi:outer membrane receptor protein involved in Fe transport
MNILFFFLAGLAASAGDVFVLQGTVRDDYNKTPLPEVHVVINEIQAGTVTNNKGVFTFSKLPPGNYTILITHPGYFSDSLSVNFNTNMTGLTIFLRPDIIDIDPETITATLNSRKNSGIPGRVALLPPRQTGMLPANNTDGLLAGVANVYIHRPRGIFSKSANVSMRGLPGSARSLLLLNGVPMNKLAGGAMNWSFIEPQEVEKIEVSKGPNSAIYGNNAMGGVISISSPKPKKPVEGRVSTFGGSMGTFGGAFGVGGIDLYRGSGYYWKVNGFSRRSNGYYSEPEESRDSLDTKVDLREYNAGILFGYQFNPGTSLDVQYRYYNGHFGSGIKVFEKHGAFEHYQNHLASAGFEKTQGKMHINARLFYQLEHYNRQSENINPEGVYKLSDSRSVINDYGFRLNLSRRFAGNHLLTAGAEGKMGGMKVNDIYRTSSDKAEYGGKLAVAGIFIQDEISLRKNISLVAGLRFDYAQFFDGYREAYQLSTDTGSVNDISTRFEANAWQKLSPKLAIHYRLKKNLGVYVSASTGFTAPAITDLTVSGEISEGYIVANPRLRPECIINYETGLSWMAGNRLVVEPSVYYSRGHDLQYFVATVDSAITGGHDPGSILQRQNIGEIEIAGAEISATWKALPGLAITANYSINHSRIIKLNDPGPAGKELSGKSLTGVPASMAYASVCWRNKVLNLLVDWQFTGDQWYNNVNTAYIPAHHLFNVRISKNLSQGIGISLSMQNISDNKTIDRKGKLPPGRFVMAEITYRF